jgi:hypothetical protein
MPQKVKLDMSTSVPLNNNIELDMSTSVPLDNHQPQPSAPKPTFWERLGFPAGTGSATSNVQPPPISASERNNPVDYAHPVRGDEAGDGPGDLLMHGLAQGSKDAGNYYVDQGPHQVVEGIKDVSHGNYAVGGHKIISGGMTTALPLAPEAMVANPWMAARAIAGGYAGGKIAGLGAEAFGANPDQKQFAEDLGNLAGGAAGSALNGKISGTILQKTGQAVVKAAPYVGKGAGEAARFGGVGEFLHSGNPLALAGPVVAPFVKQAATAIVKGGGDLLVKGGDFLGGRASTGFPLFDNAPKLGTSPINTSFNAPSPIVQVRTDPFVPSQMQPIPTDVSSPSSFSGSNVTSNPKPLKATTPKAAQTEVLRNMGIAAPSATIKPLTKVPTATITPRPDLSFAGSNSGESAALNQLSENFSPDRLGINDLRGIAQARGIKVGPGDNHAVLIGRIHDSLTPDELDRFEQAARERMQPDYSIPSAIAPPQ